MSLGSFNHAEETRERRAHFAAPVATQRRPSAPAHSVRRLRRSLLASFTSKCHLANVTRSRRPESVTAAVASMSVSAAWLLQNVKGARPPDRTHRRPTHRRILACVACSSPWCGAQVCCRSSTRSRTTATRQRWCEATAYQRASARGRPWRVRTHR